MKPYYSDEAVTIYHADCREILPSLPKVDLVLTDPPYGIAHVSGGGTGGKWHNVRHQGVTIRNDESPFDPALILRLNAPYILWGANFYSEKLPGSGWLIWDKRHGIEDMNFNRSDSELAAFSESKTVKTFRYLWHGLCRQAEIGDHFHPTQKPISLMAWCMNLVPDAELILDPYCGAGSTLRAAKDLGRKAVGIEIEEKYCEIAAKRMSQEVLRFEAVA